MNPRVGFFEVDCRELDEAGTALQLRQRVGPLAEKLTSLYDLADTLESPVIFTTCCSGKMLLPDSLPDVLFVPLAPGTDHWLGAVGRYRTFHLQKNAYGDPKKNFSCRAFDVFQDNANARALLEALDVDEWVVFGNGFDLCVNATARGLLALGQKVCLLTDVFVRSARGYAAELSGGSCECGTPEAFETILSELQDAGARTSTLAALQAERMA